MWRKVVVGVVFGIAVTLTSVCATPAVASPGGTTRAEAAAVGQTQATVFRAFTATGAPTIGVRSKSGYCWTGSLTTTRRDAWRCLVGNYIYDPCFSSASAHGVVVCPGLQMNSGVEIWLTRGLPRPYANHGTPSVRQRPWNIELATGKHYAFSSGASNLIHGVRLNYFTGAGSTYGLWGYPNRQTEPWTIWGGPFTATSLHERLRIRHVWM